ncbi:MAG: hypothetical protein VXZ39_11560 [Planctomycetota bacterium]|nr:hypothetical protein [Planctomycetota bacterium]MEC8510971.1 hypothetical protein [Planctomycetota bacterium]
MRALIGLMVLGTLFVMAASWQSRMTSELRKDRSQRYNVADDSAPGQEGWSRLILGRPSGADPLLISEPRGPVASFSLQEAPRPVRPDPTPAPRFRRDRVHRVRPNEVLGKICQENYEVRPLATVVERVAIYNDLASPNDIREGQELLLPDPAVLFPERPRR